MITKEEEIKLLRKLCNEDTYIAQYFGKDLDTMIHNINNDFAIETNTTFNANAERLEEMLTVCRNAHIKEKTELINTLLNISDKYKIEEAEDKVLEFLGEEATIIRKHELKHELDSDEIDFLIKKLKTNSNERF